MEEAGPIPWPYYSPCRTLDRRMHRRRVTRVSFFIRLRASESQRAGAASHGVSAAATRPDLVNGGELAISGAHEREGTKRLPMARNAKPIQL